MGKDNGRVTYKDIMDFQEKVFDELTDIRAEISATREAVALDRGRVKGLLRRDTWGYVWDTANTLFNAALLALFKYQGGL